MKVKSKSIVETITLKNQNLSPNVEYHVLGFDDENYRVLNDRKEPILYPKYLFEVTDISYPKDWVEAKYEDGEYFVDPVELSDDDFYDKYFNGDAASRDIFKNYCLNKGLISE